MMTRIAARFAALKATNRKAFIPFITAGDPDPATFATLLAGLPRAGADLIEIGMPFSDPMADGPAIERANLRALAHGVTLKSILAAVAAFRKTDDATPIVLMGYVNPILSFGMQAFAADAATAGVDGLIVADLPPEEDAELRAPCSKHGLDLIRLAAPTSTDARLDTVLRDATGFLYYVAVAGITGSRQADIVPVQASLARIRSKTALPVAVGFGIATPDQARAIARVADAVVVGSAIVRAIEARLDMEGKAHPDLVAATLDFVAGLAAAVH